MVTEEQRVRRHLRRWKRKFPNEPYPGYTRSVETREKQSKANLGKPSPMLGKHHTEEAKIKLREARMGKHLTEEAKAKLSRDRSGENHYLYGKHLKDETKAKQSLALSGENHPMYGKHHTQESRIQMSMTKQGITNREEYKGHAKTEKYCWKWTSPRLKIRKRVRAFFGNRCIDCGKTKAENSNQHLHVNHVGNNKQACCVDNPEGWLFVPLCTSCHTLASGINQCASDKKYIELINTKYGGKCYYSLEEYDQLVKGGKLKTEDYGRRDGR